MVQEPFIYRGIDGQGEAFGRPGLPARWTSSMKDVVGTAYSTASRLWYTISHGTVNEVYFPTIDRPQVRDLELMVTDEETFVHEEKRDLEHTFEYIDEQAPAVRLTNRDPENRYAIVKEVISDPHAPALLMHVRLEGDPDFLRKLKFYALLAPHLEIGGAGNSGRVVDIAGDRLLLAWKDRLSLAMAASCGFSRASCGFVGASDGWQDLMRHGRMMWEFGSALDGNIALMGEIGRGEATEFTVAVGAGLSHHAALARSLVALNAKFAIHRQRFIEQWRRTHYPAELAAKAGDQGRLLRISHQVLLAHEDKSYPGALIASASIPWGQDKGDADLGGYHLVWTRDMTQSATALVACGQLETARRALVYLACTQKPDGGFAQNFWINGTPYWTGMQLDETAFPILLAWRLWKLEGLGEFDIVSFVERAAGFLVRHAPVTQQERWEEVAGYSPSTLAVVIAGLVCGAEIVRAAGAEEQARFLEEQADWLESHLEDWTVTNEGVLPPGVKRYYMRIRPPETGDPYTEEGPGTEKVRLANRAPDEQAEYEAREIVDAGFLDLVRFGIRAPDDPLIVDSLKVVDAVLKRNLPQGPCWRRYNHDGYGQRQDGGPYDGWGQGRVWPLLTGERAHYELARGGDPETLRNMMEQSCSEGGMLPEQSWDAADIPEKGMIRGRPTGSAMPLVWAHAEYMKLLRSLADGVVFDRIPALYERYAQRRGPGSQIEVWRQDRQPRRMRRGKRLRVQSQDAFHLVWSADGWKTNSRVESTAVGSAGFFADAAPGEEAGAIAFTLYWPEENRWEGRNYEVAIGQ